MTDTTSTLHPGLNLGASHGSAHAKSEVTVFGLWVFLMSDLIIFGILFATHVSMRTHTAGGPGPADLFDLTSIAWQTAFLLTSSLTFGFASLALKHGEDRRMPVLWLVVTALLGALFLGFEIRDFLDMAAKDGVPTRSGWLSSFYALVGLHGTHIAFGLLWVTVTLLQVAILGLSDRVKTRILMLGLFWHFLDLIWIAIFSIVFLAGMA